MKGEGQGSYKSWAEMLLLCRPGHTDLTFPAGHKLATVFWTAVKGQLLRRDLCSPPNGPVVVLLSSFYNDFRKYIEAQRSEAIAYSHTAQETTWDSNSGDLISEPTLLTTARSLRSLRRHGWKGSRILSAYRALREAPPFSSAAGIRGEGLGRSPASAARADPGPAAEDQAITPRSAPAFPTGVQPSSVCPISQECRHLVTFLH